MTSDTWGVKVNRAGDDRSCTVNWDGLVTQRFFDVESVLLGGAGGSTNTAMTLASFLLGLILITLVVLVRRVNNADEEEWVEDAFEDEDAFENEDEMESEAGNEGTTDSQSTDDEVPHTEGQLSDDLKASLAKKAGEVGVMQAAPGTEQGQSGWYVDVSTEVQYWNVGDDGSWTQVS